MCSFNLYFSFPPNNYIDELNDNMVVKWNEIKNGHTWGSPNADRFISAEKSGYIPTVKSFPSLFCFMTQCEQSDPLSYSLVIQSEPLPKSQSRLSYFLCQREQLPKSLFSFFHDHILVQFVDSIVWRKGKVEKSYLPTNPHVVP